MEPAQHGVQEVLNISTEVHVFHHTRLDLDHARLEKDHARLDLDHEVSQNDRDFSLLARLPHTARTRDRTDELIDPFDQFMHFYQPNLTKARIFHLSEDIGHTWSSMVHDLDMVVHTDSPTSFVLLTAVHASGYNESGQKPNSHLSISSLPPPFETITRHHHHHWSPPLVTTNVVSSDTTTTTNADVPQSTDHYMEPAQHGVQEVLNISTEVHVFHHTRLDLDHARLDLGGEKKGFFSWYQSHFGWMFGLLKKSKLQQDVYFPFKTVNKETKGRDKTSSMMMRSGSGVVIVPSPKPREATVMCLIRTSFGLCQLGKDAMKTTRKTLSTRCFKCHRVGYYANKCQKQKSLVTLEKIETEPEKEDPLPFFDDYAHEPKEESGGEQTCSHKEGSSSIHKPDRTQDVRTNLFEEEGNDVPQSTDHYMEPAQHGVQDVLNISTEVHVFHRIRLDLVHARLEKDHARLEMRKIMPELTWIMPDLMRIMPDLTWIMPDLTWIMPDLTWVGKYGVVVLLAASAHQRVKTKEMTRRDAPDDDDKT
uniref:CCHC-type domain-containing protein n=1 Tax=Brassica oleracea var. oleracea TaxID=109376 RepID=A0A0D2ZTW5_BRAOL